MNATIKPPNGNPGIVPPWLQLTPIPFIPPVPVPSPPSERTT